MVDIDRVGVDVEVADRCAAEILVEDEIVMAAVAENRNPATDIGKRLVLTGSVDHRRAVSNQRDGQRLNRGGGVPVTDDCVERGGGRSPRFAKTERGVGGI